MLSRYVALTALGVMALATAFAGGASVSAPVLADAPLTKVQGLTVTFSANGKSDVRAARLVAL